MLLPSGNPFKCHEEVMSLQSMIPPKSFEIFPPDWGMLRMSRCVQIFLQTQFVHNFSTTEMRGSTIGEGGDTTISSPGRSPKQPLPGMRLHDPLHGRQACPEFIAFDQGVGQICPRYGLFSCRSLPKRGQIFYIPAPSPNRRTGQILLLLLLFLTLNIIAAPVKFCR